MANAYSYSCKDCEGMEFCPASLVAATETEVWKLIKLHAEFAHGEDPADWDDETRTYLATLIVPTNVRVKEPS